jgi:hypothetical protein
MKKHFGIEVDIKEGFDSITLFDILSNISNGQNFNWSILWIHAVGNLGDEHKNMLDFEKEIDDSESGLVINWKDLVNLSTKFDDIMELLLIGVGKIEQLKKYETDEEMYLVSEYAIELVDSSYWLIHSNNFENLESIVKKLPGVIGVD